MDSWIFVYFEKWVEERTAATHQISGQHFYHFDQSVHSLPTPLSASSAGSSSWSNLLVELHCWSCSVRVRKQSFQLSFFMPCLYLKGWSCKNPQSVSLMFIGVVSGDVPLFTLLSTYTDGKMKNSRVLFQDLLENLNVIEKWKHTVFHIEYSY